MPGMGSLPGAAAYHIRWNRRVQAFWRVIEPAELGGRAEPLGQALIVLNPRQKVWCSAVARLRRSLIASRLPAPITPQFIFGGSSSSLRSERDSGERLDFRP